MERDRVVGLCRQNRSTVADDPLSIHFSPYTLFRGAVNIHFQTEPPRNSSGRWKMSIKKTSLSLSFVLCSSVCVQKQSRTHFTTGRTIYRAIYHRDPFFCVDRWLFFRGDLATVESRSSGRQWTQSAGRVRYINNTVQLETTDGRDWNIQRRRKRDRAFENFTSISPSDRDVTVYG